ncbi:hypothetical protein Trydic_g12605 [Trypoxylus dichotomus]
MMPCSTIYDGYATIRRPRVGPPRAPPRPPSLACVPEDPRIASDIYRTNTPTIPWWELATRRSRYRSCPSLELHTCTYTLIEMTAAFLCAPHPQPFMSG